MILLPTQLLVSLILGLIAFFVFLLGVGLLLKAFSRPRRRVIYRDTTSRDRVAVDIPVRPTRPAASPLASLMPFILPALLLILSLGGKYLVLAAQPAGTDEPREMHGAAQTITRPDGARLRIETFGDSGLPTLVLTHGWSLDSAEWYYVKKDLATRYRLVVWDLPGLGKSTRPDDRDFNLDTLADDLGAVIDAAGAPKIVLVGHSIGGMINLTFCRRFPDRLSSQVAGIVELNTTYTDPVKTTKNASTSTALQKPVFEPILYASIPLSPAIRALNWFSYQSGLAHMQAATSFAGTETRGQFDFAARYNYKSSPAVVARGTLGMLHWDATDELPRVSVPVLLIAGDKDTTTLPSASERMKASMPSAQLQIMQPAAHMGVLERNREYDEAIAAFSASVWDAVKPASRARRF